MLFFSISHLTPMSHQPVLEMKGSNMLGLTHYSTAQTLHGFSAFWYLQVSLTYAVECHHQSSPGGIILPCPVHPIPNYVSLCLKVTGPTDQEKKMHLSPL